MKFSQSVLCRGATIALVRPHLVAIDGLGAIFLAIALTCFRRMLERAQ
ncbi:hypothetical protein QA640_20165 [Bradyrhizobium sp. CB82]|nr:hypothetical protein [Bradyrhizobium sp. CB82]WFU44554.1 hypothetical protein QA640_20165 [Bradyrhizobium sp. CB82]